MRIVSCFSYKGGAGRSTLAINVIPFLAETLGATADHPLILVDMDIDSCGLTYLFDVMDDLEDSGYYVQNLFGEGQIPCEDKEISRHNLFTHLKPVGQIFNKGEREILCLPALPGSSMGGQGIGNNYEGDFGKCEAFIKECKKVGCCGILFDSAVGDQLTARWSNKYATHIMCCMRPTKQFREGTKRFFDEFDEVKFEKKIIVIPNVVPTDELDLQEGGEIRHYPNYAREQIMDAFADNIEREEDTGNTYIMDMVNGDVFGIPKIDRFMWQEGILENLAKDELTECEKIALKQYKKIATLISED